MVCTIGGGIARNGLDADMEAKVGAGRSGIKPGGIPQGNPGGMAFGTKWALAAGTVEETTSDITVLWGGVAGGGEG
jgi:hypothetical protein